jgi:hypothetical protein
MAGFSAQSNGGGFFFSPFSSTQVFGLYTPTPDIVPLSYGPWFHIVPVILTRNARWLTMHVSPGPLPPVATYNVQLGLGPAGFERLWQPSDGNSFYIDWLSPAPATFVIPFVMSFPITVVANNEISVRCSASPAPVGGLNVTLYVFN